MQKVPLRLWRSTSLRWGRFTVQTERACRGSRPGRLFLVTWWRFLVSDPKLEELFLCTALPAARAESSPSRWRSLSNCQNYCAFGSESTILGVECIIAVGSQKASEQVNIRKRREILSFVELLWVKEVYKYDDLRYQGLKVKLTAENSTVCTVCTVSIVKWWNYRLTSLLETITQLF